MTLYAAFVSESSDTYYIPVDKYTESIKAYQTAVREDRWDDVESYESCEFDGWISEGEYFELVGIE